MSSLEKRPDVAPTSVRPGRSSPHRTAEAAARLRKRQRAETFFQWLGKSAIAIGLGFVVVLFATIVWQGQSAVTQTHVRLDITFDPSALGLGPSPAQAKSWSGLKPLVSDHGMAGSGQGRAQCRNRCPSLWARICPVKSLAWGPEFPNCVREIRFMGLRIPGLSGPTPSTLWLAQKCFRGSQPR